MPTTTKKTVPNTTKPRMKVTPSNAKSTQRPLEGAVGKARKLSEVSRKADDAVLLHAFRDVIEETHLCGMHSCLVVFETFLELLAQQSYHLVVFAVCLVILIPTLILPLWRRLLMPMVDGMADERMRRMYNTPYGIQHYTSTHPLLYRTHDDGAMYGPYPGGRKHV